MVNRLKRISPVFGLVLMVAVTVTAFAAASASALSWVPTKGGYPSGFTASGGAMVVSTGQGQKMSCGSIAGVGKFTSGSEGTVGFTLGGCDAGVGGGTCTSPGASAGNIRTAGLNLKLVYLDKAHTKYGMLLSPPAGTPFSEFDCGSGLIHRAWTGSLILRMDSPALNVTTSKGHLTYTETSSGVQDYRGVEENIFPFYALSQTTNGGSSTSVAWTGQQNLGFNESGKLTP